MRVKKTLAVIPARGGSKGIPRKNLRPLNGKPLIFYSINACLKARNVDRVVVSTEDEEIQLFAERFGAEVIRRPVDLAEDFVPVDPVVLHAVETCEGESGEAFDYVLTVQPTSPLLESMDIDAAIERLKRDPVETVLSVCEDRHLRWEMRDGQITPAYCERVNRQYLPEAYRETGAIIACKRQVLERGTRIGKHIGLQMIDACRSIDIDSYGDLWLCEVILKKKRIVIVVTGNATTGMGHVYRTRILAHELVNHDIIFVCKEIDDLAARYICLNNYKVEVVPEDCLLEKILSLNPHLVINDILDTSADYVVALKKSGAFVINFEDMGPGAEVANLVFNALYPHTLPQRHIVVGPKCFCLRDEFLHIEKRERDDALHSVLLTFGGVDEGNLTCRILKIVAGYCRQGGIRIDVVVGPGYSNQDELGQLVKELDMSLINVVAATNRISELMNRADVAITSGGRTVFELASLGVPTVVICQNLRESMHTFASSENGIVNLGLRYEVDDETIDKVVSRVFSDAALRRTMIQKMSGLQLQSGKRLVMEMIGSFLQ